MKLSEAIRQGSRLTEKCRYNLALGINDSYPHENNPPITFCAIGAALRAVNGFETVPEYDVEFFERINTVIAHSKFPILKDRLNHCYPIPGRYWNFETVFDFITHLNDEYDKSFAYIADVIEELESFQENAQWEDGWIELFRQYSEDATIKPEYDIPF